MSKIVNISILFPNNVLILLNYNYLILKGPFGIITKKLYSSQNMDLIYNLKNISINYSNKKSNKLSFTIYKNNYLSHKQFYHNFLYLFKKYIDIISTGFIIILQAWGIGYKILKKESNIYLYLGYSHLIEFPILNKIELKPFRSTFLFLIGHLKNDLLLNTYKLKKLRKKDIYKGKGIRFINETIKLKTGKKD